MERSGDRYAGPERRKRPYESPGTGIPGDTAVMGFNPFRARRRSAADYIYVAAGLVLSLALVLWAAGAF